MKIRIIQAILFGCICVLTADEFDKPVLRESWRDEVLSSLNWDHPGLETAKKFYQAGDKKRASAAFVKYLREKKQPAVIAALVKRPNVRSAKEGLAYTWRQCQNSYTFPNKKIDWHFNMTAGIPGMLDDEWQWQLNRMHWFNDMAGMYLKTKDPAYPATFVRQLRSWAVSCPMPSRRQNVRGSTWRTIECGLRLSKFWAGAYTAFIKAPEFTDDDVIMYCYLSLIQRRFLVKHNTTANIFIMEMHGIYTFSAMFPEFKDAGESRKYAVKMLGDRINTMLLPDGFLNELTNSYHNSVVGNMILVCRIARDCGFGGEIPESFIAPLERAFDAQLKMMTPAFDMPLSNDTVHAYLWQNFKNAVTFFPKRPEFQWVASQRKRGKAPDFLSVVMPWAGFAVLRESWDPEANYLCFDIGALGLWHFHQDKLNITIWKGQDQLLYDDGGGSYAHSKFRKYARSSLGHNLVSVDGLGQLRTWTDMKNRQPQGGYTGDFKSDGQTDYVRGEYDLHWDKEGNRICRHERQVIFIRPRIFVVLDRLIPMNDGVGKSHKYQARWHVDTTRLVSALKGHPAVMTTAQTSAGARERVRKNPAERARLIVAPLFTQKMKSSSLSNQLKGQWNELAGFYAAYPHRPTTTILHEKEGMGEQRFLTLFIPLGAAEANPLAAVSQQKEDKALVKFSDGKVLTVDIVNGQLSARLK
ncbi:MAG: alginate lyase family protein [Lentisphaeria bacterium]|nr:alginate lyase family protein [Lentisphaeria bacterium]